MALVIVETQSDTPLTPEEPTATDLQVLNCLTERNATWQYSLLSSDRLRMICIFQSPDVESVRESYRRGGGSFSLMWGGEIIRPAGTQPQRNEAILKVFEGTYPGGFTQEQWDEGNRNVLPCYTERGVEWLHSYMARDRTRLICELNAPDAEVIRESHRKFNIPFDRVWSAMVIKP